MTKAKMLMKEAREFDKLEKLASKKRRREYQVFDIPADFHPVGIWGSIAKLAREAAAVARKRSLELKA